MKPLTELEKVFREEVSSALKQEFGYKNALEVPTVKKIVVNTCIAEATQNAKILDEVAREISNITGQKPVLTHAKKSISNFKLREGQAIGCRVTLREKRMWEFLHRLIHLTLPRVRDFRGISGKAFDGKGNYTLGVKEHMIFPEVNYDRVTKTWGMNISIVTSAKTDGEAKSLLKHLGMPFRN